LVRIEVYRKILVPLDGSITQSGKAIEAALELLHPEGEGILLRVVPPGGSSPVSLRYVSASHAEREERSLAKGYLDYFANQLNDISGGGWRSEVIVSKSVAQGIADFAVQEQVDLIAMYTHDRRGLAKFMKGSITEAVKARANTEVRAIRPRELIAA
jgi:nucleotide-binding universal stress UspA family protein